MVLEETDHVATILSDQGIGIVQLLVLGIGALDMRVVLQDNILGADDMGHGRLKSGLVGEEELLRLAAGRVGVSHGREDLGEDVAVIKGGGRRGRGGEHGRGRRGRVGRGALETATVGSGDLDGQRCVGVGGDL